jgi:hypothetical protein
VATPWVTLLTVRDDAFMRKTVILDDDLAELRRRALEQDVPFTRVLNEVIRAGLTSGIPVASPYRMKPRRLRMRPTVDLAKALGRAAELEDTETIRRLEQRRAASPSRAGAVMLVML